ncbi:diguanylate cyclase (GGDEF)-like protein [Rhodopseudomonas rhenobacensis]|uniref:diguanylate cyclase n=1 Tax=Rhodopseudomonas rhenobacensis TaxID=87461 RepID=A0A7W7Z3L3_9BRAD|nr:GGDEF domain-containing protein [Rhodopseudomonas rhenobacensis]MBB5047392.1 diguanylate cyclase (GGDEF)-like protein [Rhodopseudomonas rhenobacensis]
MLSVPTLWLVVIGNFIALGLVWTYVMRSYPNFVAAPYWTAAAFVAALAAATALLRSVIDSPLPQIIGSAMMIMACCLGSMGMDRFFGRPALWRLSLSVVGLSVMAFSYFSFVDVSIPMRIVVYSIGEAVPIMLSLRHLVWRQDKQQHHPGSRMTAAVAAAIVVVLIVRSIAALTGIGGELRVLHFNPLQAFMVLLLVFLSMMWCFGFLLMTIDRLRAEVAKLAMLDDLTGAANRRQLLQRLEEECALSRRTAGPFALLAIDLDGFKAINDSYGHATGDACLRDFTRTAQSCLRSGDLLARIGGDEFSVLLPATTLREGAMIARRLLEACRGTGQGTAITVSVSIGVAQWTKLVGADAERLIAAADHALYAAKKSGKNRHAVYEPASEQPAASELEDMPLLRQTA